MSDAPSPTVIQPEPVRMTLRVLAPTLQLGEPPRLPPRQRWRSRKVRRVLELLAALQLLDWLIHRGSELGKLLWHVLPIRRSRRASSTGASRRLRLARP